MPCWWHDTDTITLYHGTSSDLLTTIGHSGLQAPQLDDAGLARLAHTLAPDVELPATDWAELLASLQYARDGARAQRIYTVPAPAFDRAAGYARAYAADGGEVTRILRSGLAARAGVEIAPPFPTANAVVLEIEAPRAAVSAFRDLDELAERVRRAWHAREDWTRGFPDRTALFAEITDFEAYLEGPVPVDWIRGLHTAT